MSLAAWGGPTNPTHRFQAGITNSGTFPALTIAGGATPYHTTGDADGDGIADCGLVPLGFPSPARSSPASKWYYGVRIIDGNSAINANTAWTNGKDGRHFTVRRRLRRHEFRDTPQ